MTHLKGPHRIAHARVHALLGWGGIAVLFMLIDPSLVSASETGEINAKFVFIAFPDRDFAAPGGCNEQLVDLSLENSVADIVTEAHQAMVDSVVLYVENISLGQLHFGSETGILLPHGESLEGDGQAQTWLADECAAAYRNHVVGGVDCAVLPDAYYVKWDADTEDWRTESGPTELHTEILWKIWQNYKDLDPEILAGIDRLYFIYLTLDSPVSGQAGGEAALNYRIPNSQEHQQAFAFFQNVANGPDTQSVQCEMSTVEWPAGSAFHVHRAAAGLLHEIGHTQGFGDGPPSLANLGEQDILNRYYYGQLNLMCQHILADNGIPVWGLAWLADSGWVEVIDFTGENRLGEVIPDLRLNREDARGRIYRYHAQNSDGQWQWFLMAFHGGHGVDVQPIPDTGDPLVPSQGLEIVHCAPGTGLLENATTVDLESAFGRYTIYRPTLPDNPTHSPHPAWGVPDPVRGFDNYDRWAVEDNPDHAYRDAEEFDSYIGDVFDFFRIDLDCRGGVDGCWNRSEFSFRTNPSSLLYQAEPEEGSYYRLNPQDEPNSLIVRVREQHNGFDNALGYPHMVVDLLSAPYAELVGPASDMYDPGETVWVAWDSTFHDVLTSVDVDYSRFGGDSWNRLIENALITPACQSLPIALNDRMSGTHCTFRVTFHNQLTQHTATVDLPWTFPVSGESYPAEDILTPAANQACYTGNAVTVTWTDHFWGHPDDDRRTVGVDLEILAPTPRIIPFPFQDIIHDAGTHRCSATWRPDNQDVSPEAQVRLIFHTASGGTAYSAPSPHFPVYPLGVSLHDYTDDVFPAGDDYSGAPYSMVGRDVGGASWTAPDGRPDLIVASRSTDAGNDLARSQVFTTDEEENAAGIRFSRWPSGRFSGNPPTLLALGTAAGDFDRDGDEDLFVANQTFPQLFRNDGGSQMVDIARTQGVFVAADPTLLQKTVSANWVDFDHDGDLDLYCGRASGDVTTYGGGPGGGKEPANDVLWRNESRPGQPRFVDGTAAAGLDTEPGQGGITVASAWADANNDGCLEFVRGDLEGNSTVLYRELVGEPGRYEMDASFAVDGPVNCVLWVDLDHKHGLDLVFGRIGMPPLILCSGPSGGWQEIPASDLPPLGPLFTSAQITNCDLNHDGWQDLVIGSYVNEESPKLWMNLGAVPDFEAPFKGVASDLMFDQVENNHSAQGLATADFDEDGDGDFALGRLTSSGRYYTAADESEGQSYQWLGLVLSDPDGGIRSPIGARVTLRDVSTGSVIARDHLDGGSGRGSQREGRLLFGVGPETGDVEAEIYWPSGAPQYVVVAPPFDRTVEIHQSWTVAICESTISFAFEYDPLASSMDWLFHWTTDNWSDSNLDRIEIEKVRGNSCGFASVSLAAGDPNVTVEIERTSAATGSYTHTLRWQGQPCYLGCTYRFKVFSRVAATKQEIASTYHQLSFPACPSSN